jgi:hypothetical protein
MEQIYYTQCPMGYGLGATSGFQIKRKSAGYPASGDFRHLALRAFLPGSRELAPGTLRYRHDGGAFEVAWLTPRTHEYVAEDGRLWGRPGGQFAHGLRLDAAELESIAHWPAGLQGAAFWRASDPVATLRLEPDRQEPDPVAIGPAELLGGGDFGRVRELAEPEPADWLAGLLAACAWAARESRTLFLIDRPERLGPVVALLTFAFPRALRGELSFSTYNDRPEELAGFRIQGTVAAARPNRAVLASLGVVADRESRTLDPVMPVPAWARRLAGWLKARDAGSEQAWIETDRRASEALRRRRAEDRWADDWLDHLFGFHESVTRPVPVPARSSEWAGLKARAAWAAGAGLTAEWLQAHDPAWWHAARSQAADPLARDALRGLLRRAAAWNVRHDPAGLAARWGGLLAGWFADPEELASVTEEALQAAPKRAQGAFLAALFQGLPRGEADAWIARLKADGRADAALLLPVEAAQMAAALRGGEEPEGWDQIIARALEVPEATASTLEAIAGQLGDDGPLIGRFAGHLAASLTTAEGDGWDAAWRWALGRADCLLWLSPFLAGVFTTARNRPEWERLRRRTPPGALAALARAALVVARSEGSAPEALPWCVEALLLPSGQDPHAERWWINHYVERVCGLDLMLWIFGGATRKPAVARWVLEAVPHQAIGPENLNRLRTAKRFARVLARREPLADDTLPDVPEVRRGELLERLLESFGDVRSADFFRVLDVCRRAWPGGFDPGSAGLAGIGRVLAGALLREADRPEVWLGKLGLVLDALDLSSRPDGGLGPDGLAAHIVAETSRRIENADRLRAFRQAVFDHDGAWKALALDVRASLAGVDPKKLDLVIEQWDKGLSRGSSGLTGRFFELMLNASDAPAMLAIVASKAAELPGLGPLPWWWHEPSLGQCNDLRDAFALLVPMEPLRLLAGEKFHRVKPWMESAGPQDVANSMLEVELSPDDRARVLRDDAGSRPGHLSPQGQARWRCLKALTAYDRQGQGAVSRLQTVQTWIHQELPLAELEPEDRKQFAAVVIRGLDDFDENDITGQLRHAEDLAKWLVQSGIKSLSWLPNEALERGSRSLVNTLRQKIRDETSGPASAREARRRPPAEPGLSV